MLCKAACPATCIQLVVLLSAWYGVACLKQQPRVAIIGAGIGGTAAAYFLREELGPEVHLDIFEQGEVGGRTQIWQNGSEVYEMGASIIHEENKYFRELADKMGLERVQLGDDSNEVSIWDGQAFVFNESAWSLVTLYRMIRRYGLSYFYMRGAPAETLQRYKRLYDIQAEGQAFDTPEELLKAVDLYNLTQRTFRDELLVMILIGDAEAQGRIGWGTAAQKFAEEFVAGINRIQYNQGNGINAMAGMVSMLGAIDGRLFNIKGGNRQLAERLIKASDASLHLGTRVTGIYRREHGTYELHTKCTSASLEDSHSSKYDAVLVAVPLELTNITISGADHTGLPRRVYQRTVATLVRGCLRPSYFGVQQVPKGEYVMVTENSTAPFSVVSRQREVPEGRKVFKLFSRQPLSNETLQSIFQDLTVLAVRDWEAYPHFSPPERFQPFKLAPGLYLNNAWENSASAMEMSAVAAKNCALLIARHLREPSACQVPGALAQSAKGSDVAAILDS